VQKASKVPNGLQNVSPNIEAKREVVSAVNASSQIGRQTRADTMEEEMQDHWAITSVAKGGFSSPTCESAM